MEGSHAREERERSTQACSMHANLPDVENEPQEKEKLEGNTQAKVCHMLLPCCCFLDSVPSFSQAARRVLPVHPGEAESKV